MHPPTSSRGGWLKGQWSMAEQNCSDGSEAERKRRWTLSGPEIWKQCLDGFLGKDGHGKQPLAGESRLPTYGTLTQAKEPRKLPLVDDRGRLNVELKGYPQRGLYLGDLFHTLVNLPSWQFTTVLFFSYGLLFISFGFGFYYDAYHNNCIPGVNTFTHAVWFSVQTSMTIGYGGELAPDPECLLTNALVALQSIASLLVAYSLLGVVYARFARPTRRASTLVFSRSMVLHEDNGVVKLACRVANIRKHQVIEAKVRMLVALNNVWTQENEAIFRFTNLPVLGGNQVFLGLPCTVVHPVSQSSPLYGLSYEMMERSDLEILVLLEGVDASTSAKLQARHSYRPSDIQYNHRFATMVTRRLSGRRCVDFTLFHTVVPVPPFPLNQPRLPPRSPSRSPMPHHPGSVPPPLPAILQTPTALSSHTSPPNLPPPRITSLRITPPDITPHTTSPHGIAGGSSRMPLDNEAGRRKDEASGSGSWQGSSHHPLPSPMPLFGPRRFSEGDLARLAEPGRQPTFGLNVFGQTRSTFGVSVEQAKGKEGQDREAHSGPETEGVRAEPLPAQQRPGTPWIGSGARASCRDTQESVAKGLRRLGPSQGVGSDSDGAAHPHPRPPHPHPRGARYRRRSESSTQPHRGRRRSEERPVRPPAVEAKLAEAAMVVGSLEESLEETSAVMEARKMDSSEQVAAANQRARFWRKLVVDLASQVQESSLSHSPDGATQPLLDSCQQALQRALAYDSD